MSNEQRKDLVLSELNAKLTERMKPSPVERFVTSLFRLLFHAISVEYRLFLC